MRKLLLLSVVLFLFVGCSKDETTDPGQADQTEAFVPHFYGVAMLDTPAPATRGVANALKVWSKPMASNNLTVKFLNGSTGYQEYVKEVAKEWEKAAGVRFHFVESDKAATVRIGFDYVPGMMSSWSLTGTDHMQVYGPQTEATMHFAQWRRAGDAQRRSDVLRAFGQVLGLELEFRHPMFHPAWITNADGSVNETAIREYWENELANYISWDELKKIVLDPLEDQAFFIHKTEYYDQWSVMNWPLYEMIARNIPPIEFDEDYNTELSENDKTFAQSLYGESFGGDFGTERFFPLIEFEFTGSSTRFTVTTTRNLGVRWDSQVSNDYTAYDLPGNTTSAHTFTIDKTFVETKTRKIVIGEVLDYGQTKPDYSYALTKFDFTGANYARAINIMPLNHALSYVRIIGGSDFTSQVFDFSGNDFIKELYLVRVLDSRVILDNCQNLEKFGTSKYIWKPNEFIFVDSLSTTETAASGESGILGPVFPPIKDTLIIIDPPLIRYVWPDYPESFHSLSDSGGSLTLLNLPELREISLENTYLTSIDFKNLTSLEYLYLSSLGGCINGGGNPKGQLLFNTLNTLISRTEKTQGQIVLRGIGYRLQPANEEYESHVVIPGRPVIPSLQYQSIVLDRLIYNDINQSLAAKNWDIKWESGTLFQSYLMEE